MGAPPGQAIWQWRSCGQWGQMPSRNPSAQGYLCCRLSQHLRLNGDIHRSSSAWSTLLFGYQNCLASTPEWISSMIHLQTLPSATFARQGVKEMGRNLSIEGGVFFGIGMTFASFHWDGTLPCDNDAFTISVTGWLNSYANSFNNLGGIPSGPPALVEEIF